MTEDKKLTPHEEALMLRAEIEGTGLRGFIPPGIRKNHPTAIRRKAAWLKRHPEDAPTPSSSDIDEEALEDRALEIAKILGPAQVAAVANGLLPVIRFEDFIKHPELCDDSEPDWVSPWFGIRGKCIGVFSREKTGKSTLLTADAFGAARSGNNVLWISAEEFPSEIASRLKRFSTPPSGSISIAGAPPKDQEQMFKTITSVAPDLVVIDSLTSILAHMDIRIPKNSDPHSWTRIISPYRDYAHSHGVAFVIIHHENKAGEYMGSTAISSQMDGMIALHRIKEHIYKSGKGGAKIIDAAAEAAAAADGVNLYTNTTVVDYGGYKYGVRSTINIKRAPIYLDYVPETGEVIERTYNILHDDPILFIASALIDGKKTKDELLDLANTTGVTLHKYMLYKAKQVLKLKDIPKGGAYEASPECFDLVNSFEVDTGAEGDDY